MPLVEDKPVVLSLSQDEGRVLFHLLSRWAFGEGPTPPANCFDHPAEVHVVLALAHEMVPHLSGEGDGYEQDLEASRQRLMDRFQTVLLTLNGQG